MKCKEKGESAPAQYAGGMCCITVDAMHVDALHRAQPVARKTCPRTIRQKQPLKDKNDE